MATNNLSLNTSSFLTPWTIFLTSLIIVVGAIIILTIIERKLNKIILRKRIEEENSFQKRINALKQIPLKPDKLLSFIENISREFFEKKYKTNKNSKYSDLIDFFEKNNDIAAMKFCERMQESLYGGEKLDPSKVNFLLNNLEFLIDSEKRPEVRSLEEKGIIKATLSEIFNKERAQKNQEKTNAIDNKNIQKINDYLLDGLKKLNVVPYNKEEIKINKIRNVENPNVSKFINGPDNFNRLVYKIKEKKKAFLPSSQE